MTQLKLCPFCEHDKIFTDEMDLLGEGETCLHAICPTCGASAPKQVWNTRPAETRLIDTLQAVVETAYNYDAHGVIDLEKPESIENAQAIILQELNV